MTGGEKVSDIGRRSEFTEAAVRDAEAAARWWDENWSKFPTVGCDESGQRHYWSVAPDSGVFQDDWPRGEALASETVAQMQRFPEGAAVLRLILRDMDPDSVVAQGFLNRLEDMLAYPDLYLRGAAADAPKAAP